MLAIASFPRSGSHLLRFILEYNTSSFTQGILNNIADGPIFTNTFPSAPNCLSHVDPRKMIGIKCHNVEDVCRASSLVALNGIHLLVRNPYHAISSHILQSPTQLLVFLSSLNNKLFTNLFLRSRLYKYIPLMQIHLCCATVVLFQQWITLIREYFQVWRYMPHSYLMIYENLTNTSISIRKGELEKAFFSIHHLLSHDFTINFLENIDHFYDISLCGEGRSWGGRRGLKCNYQLEESKRRQSDFTKSINFNSIISTGLQKELKYICHLEHKFPCFEEYKSLLNNYLKGT